MNQIRRVALAVFFLAGCVVADGWDQEINSRAKISIGQLTCEYAVDPLGMVRRQINDTWESTKAVNPDLILYHPKAGGAEDFAERLAVPCVFTFYLTVDGGLGAGNVPGICSPTGKRRNGCK